MSYSTEDCILFLWTYHSLSPVKDSRRSVDSQESRISPDGDEKEITLHTSGSCGDLAR